MGTDLLDLDVWGRLLRIDPISPIAQAEKEVIEIPPKDTAARVCPLRCGCQEFYRALRYSKSPGGAFLPYALNRTFFATPSADRLG
jgi:hypothetical protein